MADINEEFLKEMSIHLKTMDVDDIRLVRCYDITKCPEFEPNEAVSAVALNYPVSTAHTGFTYVAKFS
ncbi:hypothetical protein Glove_718g26 [Diversispora epigaea]|uniref:Uncharacterized protein n=1 Tax=Diversispora epigaea TaxID=1348612 RepID=A0A397G0N2_9GLOM|nr:hypothetical protein Glove_718g26 [Diversispora epigaea]